MGRLTDLETKEMGALIALWLGADEAKFLSVPEIAGFRPHVARAAADVAEVLRVAADPSRTTAEDGRRFDGLHDAAAHALFHLLEARADYLRALEPIDVAQVDSVRKAQAAIFPHGTRITRKPYAFEAGEAERVEELLAADARLRGLLAGIPCTETCTAADVAALWFTHGDALKRHVEDEQSKAAARDPAASYGKSHVAARAQWVRVVSTVLEALELADAPEETLAALRGPIETAVEAAGRRQQAKRDAKKAAAAAS